MSKPSGRSSKKPFREPPKLPEPPESYVQPVGQDDYYVLDPEHSDPKRIKRERDKARKLRKSQWWKSQLNHGLCHYCGKKFAASELTMDHVVPLARGGTSVPGNVVPACCACNRDKKLETPAERLLREMAAERDSVDDGSHDDGSEKGG